MKWLYVSVILLLGFLAVGLWQRFQMQEKSAPVPVEQPMVMVLDEPIRPIPLHIKLNEKKVALGEKLFHDPQLSHDNSISCASCHDLSTGGTDRRVRSIGINGAVGSVNSPTVFNSGFHFKQFWDGRAETLEDQIDGPLHGPKEMGSNWAETIAKLKRSSYYVSTFGELYTDGMQKQNIKDAIATFERSLYTPNARFDQFLRGDSNAITGEEKEGYRLFKEYGCIKCHQGIGVGGNMFETFGVMADYVADRGNVTQADFGRFNVTGDEEDRYRFKVCSLRNVALTPPYFHDGSAQTLEEAIAIMAKYQLGRKLPPEEIDLMVKFLRTLTGVYKEKSLDTYSQ